MYKSILTLTAFLTLFYLSAQEKNTSIKSFKDVGAPIYVQLNSFNDASVYQKLDSIINYTVNDIGDTIKSLKESFFYDEAGNLITDIDYVWDSNQLQWITDFKWELSYDNSNRWTTVVISKWSKEENRWKNNYKKEFDYDEFGNATQITFFKPDSSFNSWINDYKEEFAFNSNNKPVQQLYFNWNSNSAAWVDEYKTEMQYNNEFLSNKVYYKPDSAGKWLFDYQAEYLYNNNNLLSQIKYFDWDSVTNSWINDYLNQYNYDIEENLVEKIYLGADKSGNWLEEYKEEFEYNSSNHLNQYTLFQIDTISNLWTNEKKREFSYPYSVDHHHLILPQFFFENEDKFDVNAIASDLVYAWNDEDQIWTATSKRELFFSDFEGLVNSDTRENLVEFKIFPNPVSDILYFQTPFGQNNYTLELVNLDGKLVYQNSGINEIQVNQFSPGIYLLKISENNKTLATKKIVVN
ncbi:MAG: T9SS type A sorting domain-containing protein [Draconibacterium sp.]